MKDNIGYVRFIEGCHMGVVLGHTQGGATRVRGVPDHDLEKTRIEVYCYDWERILNKGKQKMTKLCLWVY